MIAVVIGVLAVLVVAAIIWARMGASRAENRSVETYERALGVLGEVSKRTESTGFRILPHEETGRAHVAKRPEPEATAAEKKEAALEQTRPLASRRLPPAGEPKLRVSGPSRPAAPRPRPDETEAAGVAAPDPVQRALAGAAEARARQTAYRSASDHRRQVVTRRVATGATAAVALAALAVAGLYLSGGEGGAPPKRSGTTTTLRRGGSGAGTTSTTSTSPTSTSTTLANSVSPVSLSPVTFRVPAGVYTLGFQVTGGDCWVGVERSSAGPWLFNQTLSSGQSASYKGSGTLMVTLGAPVHFTMTLNGLSAELPRTTQVYTFDLVPT